MKIGYGNVGKYEGPYEALPGVHLEKDGLFQVEFDRDWKLEQSKSNNENWYVTGTLKILDPDFAGKAVPYCRQMVQGRDKDNNGMERGFLDIRVSIGELTVEQAAALVAAKESEDIPEVLADRLGGKKAYARLVTGYTNNDPTRPKTELSGFVTQKFYLQEAAANRHRQSPRPLAKKATANGATPAPYSPGGAAGANTTGAAF